MSRSVLVTGGSRSGKSSYAEGIYEGRDDILYIATAIVTDKEMEDRIQKHKEDRNSKWETYEGFRDLHKAVDQTEMGGILLDCVTIMTTNILFEKERDFDSMRKDEMNEILDDIKCEFKKLIEAAEEKGIDLVMVTNEVGSGIVPEYKISRIFRDIAGWVNQYVASLSSEVYLVSCGLPLKLK